MSILILEKADDPAILPPVQGRFKMAEWCWQLGYLRDILRVTLLVLLDADRSHALEIAFLDSPNGPTVD